MSTVETDAGAERATWYELPNHDRQVRGLVEAFRSEYGRSPDGVWGAPGRVNLLGEHIDYNGGTVLPFALPHRTLVAAALRGDTVLRARSMQEADGDEIAIADIAPGALSGWFSYVAGVPWALERRGAGPLPGLDLLIDGAVPIGAGLSSSAALESSVALAFDELAHKKTNSRALLAASDAGRAELAQACIEAENTIAGANTGGMDQTVALRAADRALLAVDCRTFETRALPFDAAGAGYTLLVVDTRASHQLADGQYARRRAGCKLAAKAFGVRLLRDVLPEHPTEADAQLAFSHWRQVARDADNLNHESMDELDGLVRHVFTEVVRVERCIELFGQGTPTAASPAWQELGELLSASHRSLRDDYRVSSPELDVAVHAAEQAGALGARMVGGGFGGSAIVLAHDDEVQRIADAVEQAFESGGFTPPAFMAAVPSAPAGRETASVARTA